MTTTLRITATLVAVLALIAGGFLWWFFAGDAPPEASLDEAVAGVEADAASTAEPTDGGTASPADITGTWTVDTESGAFDYESATGTFAGFRIDEELSGLGSVTAVGRTGDVAGTMVIGDTTVSAASFEIDLTTITTEDSRRDDNVQDALETSAFPSATFELTEPIDLGDDPAGGDPVAAVATGDLTLHGVTNTVQFDLDAQLIDSTVVVVGSTDVVFADYGLEVPTSPIVLSVEDHGTLELQFLLVQQ